MKRYIILLKVVLSACFWAEALRAGAQDLSVNLALNKVAVASSVESPSYPASYATDGIDSTFWSSGGNYAQYLYVDLGLRYQVQKVILKWADNRYASTLDIQVSDNASDWSTVITISPNTQNPVTTISGISGLGRYVKFNGRGRGTGVRYRLAEIQVYGTAPEPATPEQQAALNQITAKLLAKHIPASVDQGSVTGFLNTMQPDGSWPDIDYDDKSITGWKPGTHLNRLIALAASYRTASSVYFQSAAMLEKILLGIDYYYLRKPVSDNWWYNDIGGPQDYMIPLLLIKGQIDQPTLLKYSSYLREQTARFAGGGKNLTWIAEISIYKGCIEDDFRITDIGFKAMASTLVIVSQQGDEGIKIDNSFHQHHQQLYSGGYGMSIIADLSNYIELTGGNLFAESFSAEKRKILSDLLLDGHRLLGYRSAIDFGAMGRNISRASAYTNISAEVLDKMITGDPANAPAYQAWKQHLSGAPFPALGNKHFWKSDIMTHHGADYYLSAKILSTRTLGTEALNGENVKAYNLPLGATNILTHSNEYTNIYPVWDWSRIPGTTAEHSEQATALDGYLYGTNSFGGGVSDGKSGIIAYEHNYHELSAKKAYFFIGEAMLCLGAGITAAKSNPIITSVNQSHLSGPIHFNSGNGAQLLGQDSANFENLEWVHHDGVGYIFPQPANIAVRGASQSGSWRSINGDGSSSPISRNVFSVWFDHGNTPANASYQYLVAPGRDLAALQDFASQHGFVITQNTADIQAVRNQLSGIYAVVFYNPGTADMGDGLSITSSGKAMVLIEKTASTYQLWVSDPVYSQSSITLTLRRQPQVSSGRTSALETTLEITLPTGDLTGKSVAATVPFTALPVTLADFSVASEAAAAILTWHTVSEQNSSHFSVEKSLDGKRFEEIGRLASKGENAPASYRFTDDTAGAGTCYYRLKMLDLDGSFSYSRIAVLQRAGKSELNVFPNPAATFIKIQASSKNSSFGVKVYGLDGRLIHHTTLKATSQPRLDISKLPPGTYFLEVDNGQLIGRSKFVKE